MQSQLRYAITPSSEIGATKKFPHLMKISGTEIWAKFVKPFLILFHNVYIWILAWYLMWIWKYGKIIIYFYTKKSICMCVPNKNSLFWGTTKKNYIILIFFLIQCPLFSLPVTVTIASTAWNLIIYHFPLICSVFVAIVCMKWKFLFFFSHNLIPSI